MLGQVLQVTPSCSYKSAQKWTNWTKKPFFNLLQVLLGALLLLGPDWRCVLLTGGWQPLLEAHQALLSCYNTQNNTQNNSPVWHQTCAPAAGQGVAGATGAAAAHQQQQLQGDPRQRDSSTPGQKFQPMQLTGRGAPEQLPEPAFTQQQQLLSALPNLFVQHAAVACHHLLLEGAAVLLHHGGSGTTAAALAAGVPQLVCPLHFDQFYWVSWG